MTTKTVKIRAFVALLTGSLRNHPETLRDGAPKRTFYERVREIGAITAGECKSPFACIVFFCRQYVTTMTDAKKVYPLFKRLLPFLYAERSGTQALENAYMKLRKPDTGISHDKNPEPVTLYAQEFFRTTRDQKNLSADMAQTAKEFRLANKIVRTLAQVFENVQTGLNEGSFGQVMLALITASGARAIEIISHKVATFAPVEGQPKYVLQTGTAKSQDGNSWQKAKPLVGMNYSQFEQGLRFVRERTSGAVNRGDSNEELTVFEADATAVAKTVYADAYRRWGRLGTHIGRAVYGNASYVYYKGNDSTYDRTLWIKEMLGHSSDISNYNTVVVTNQKIEPADRDARFVEMQAEIQELRLRMMAPAPAADAPVVPAPLNGYRPAKRKRLGGDDKAFAILPNSQGEEVSIPRLKHRKNLSREEKQARVQHGEALLRQYDVKVGNTQLRALCIGACSVNLLRTGSLAAGGGVCESEL